MKRIDRRILIVLSFVFIVALSYGIMKFLISQKEEPPAFKSYESRRFVMAEIIDYDEVLSPVFETGRMASLAQVNLSAEASGKIEQGDIMLKRGANFKQGQVIFTIYRDEAELSLKASKSQFLNSLALMLPDIAVDYPEYEKTFRQFFSSINIDRPLPEFPEFKDEKLQIFLAGKNILSSYYNIRRSELQLSRHVVRAPFDGTLTEVYLEVGAYTNTGGMVARAIRTDQLELEVPLRRSDARWVKIGDPVNIASEKHSGSWNGTVIRKGNIVDENTQSQRVFVKVENQTGQALLAGEFLEASFQGRPVEGVMEIPRKALFNSNEIFLVKNKRLVKQPINIVKVNTNTLLFNGPAEGDTIVVQSLINVYEGTQVTTSLDPQPKPTQGKSGPGGANRKNS